MAERVLAGIRQMLTDAGVAFKEIEHPPTYTSLDAAQVRGEELKVGAKALLLSAGSEFKLFVLPADRKLDSAAVKRELGVKRLRFATAEELLELTGLVPGSVPPFGAPLLPFELYADSLIGAESNKVAFNAGSLTVSIIMAASDWEAVASPKRFSFAQ